MRFLAAFRAAAFLMTATQFAYPVAAQDKGPAPPTRLWAAQTDPTTITLVWQGVPGAVQYLVFGPKSKKGDAGAAIQQLATLGRSAARYVALVVSPGLSHQFSIRAVDAKGQASDQVELNPVIPQAKQAASTMVPPPSSVTAAQTGSGEVRIDWSAVPGATGYFIGRSVAPAGFNSLCQLCPTETNYLDTAVIAGAKHIYTVAAITPHGTSQKTRSNEVTPTGAKEAGVAGADAPPKGVSDMKATIVSPTLVRLTWLPGIGATSFRIRRKVGSMAAELIATVMGTVSSFLDHLPAGSLVGGIVYEIEAVNAKGRAEKATIAIAPEKAATDTAVSTPSPKGLSDLKAAVVSPTSVRLTWLPGIGTTSFRIRRTVGSMVPALIATLAGTVSSFLDHPPSGSFAAGIRYEIEAVDAKGSAEKATVTMDPAKDGAGPGSESAADSATPDEGEIDSLPRPRGRAP